MNILITGTSKGIGKAVAENYLLNNQHVYGISRSENDALRAYPKYSHMAADISDFELICKKLPGFLDQVKNLDLMILNAGVLNEVKDMKDTSVEEIKRVMDVNVWANKVLIDICFAEMEVIGQVVAISSGAAVSGSRGWNAYSISKAALNMLIRLYAGEWPETHFCALAPGIVDTDMQEYISSLPEDRDYPVVQKLKKARNTPEMPGPAEISDKLINAFGIAREYDSGCYLDVRKI